jgi:hypothetical protein
VTRAVRDSTLQAGLEIADDGDHPTGRPDRAHAAADISDPVALFHHLDASGRFHRDSRLGRMYHRGMISLRENVTADSLHIAVHGNRVKAHVDGISPLTTRSDGRSRYSARQALAHNAAGIAQDLVALLRGRQGDHRCELDCSWTAGEAHAPPAQTQLLDPTLSAASVRLEARVGGSLNEERLRAAVRSALGDRAPRRDHLDIVDCASDADLDRARERLYGTAVPLSSPPMLICLAHHPAGDVLLLNLNHAAADGAAALQVLRCIAGNYAGDDGAGTLEFLAVEDLPVGPTPTSATIPTRLRKNVVQRMRDAIARPTTIAADHAGERSGHGSHRVRLPAGATEPVAAAQPLCGRSDVLVAALQLAIGEWNDAHDLPSGRISVLTQADLRPDGWDESTIGNFSVTARMSTGRRERATPDAAMTATVSQAERNRSMRTGVALVAALERAGLLSLWAKQSVVVLEPLSTNSDVDSTMLSNLGSVVAPSFGPRAGTIVELWFAAPARAPSMLCVGAVTVAGSLHLTLRYPHRLFDARAAGRFADIYLGHLRSLAELPA